MSASALHRTGIALTLLFISGFAGLSLWYGAPAAWSDASSLRSRWLVNQWRVDQGPAYNPTLWQQTRDELQAALAITPDNAQLLDDLGFLDAARAMGLGMPAPGTAEQVLQHSLLASAIGSYRSAVSLRPTFPFSLAHLALAKHLQGEHDAEFWRVFDKALQYGHNEAGIHAAMGQIAFAQWQALGLERQRLITRMVVTAQARSRERLLKMARESGVTLAGNQP